MYVKKNALTKNKMWKEVFEKVIEKYVIYSFLWISGDKCLT